MLRYLLFDRSGAAPVRGMARRRVVRALWYSPRLILIRIADPSAWAVRRPALGALEVRMVLPFDLEDAKRLATTVVANGDLGVDHFSSRPAPDHIVYKAHATSITSNPASAFKDVPY